jgi:hypothetical protein
MTQQDQNSRQFGTETTPLLHKHTYEEQQTSKEGPVSPENKANIFSRYTFWWLNDLFRIGYSRQIQEDDLYQMLERRRTAVLGQALFDNWEAEKKTAQIQGRRPSLLRALFKSFWRRYLPAFIWLELAGMLRQVLQLRVVQSRSRDYLADEPFSLTNRFLPDRQPLYHQAGEDHPKYSNLLFSQELRSLSLALTHFSLDTITTTHSCLCSCKIHRRRTLHHPPFVGTVLLSLSSS